MKKRDVSSLLLGVSIFLFAGLLLSGAHRLIATEEAQSAAIRVPLVQAYLCSASSATTQEGASRAQSAERMEKRIPAAAVRCALGEKVKPMTCVDANGNVLRRGSYLRSVYQSFALGDGFA